MGRTYSFECPKCQYQATVAGGADEGLHFAVQTIRCRDCKLLYDAVTRARISESPVETPLGTGQFKTSFVGKRPPTFQRMLNRLRLLGEQRLYWISYKIACPASHFHRVENWKAPGKCPRCGVYMECNGLPFRIWD